MPATNGKPAAPAANEREIFLEALEQPTLEQRAAYLDRACGRDQRLRAAVEGLLGNHKQDTFLETPVVDGPRPATAAKGPGGTVRIGSVAEHAGDRIGRYKLLQQIGEGGCGVVYMAEQEEPVRRRVALKVIRLGMDTKSVIARFEAEQQALAMMDHPNIAKVLDAGATETGRPYFVMELVRGIRITDYCDQNHLPTGERLQLFIQVCQAIQHAHQKGIIHRDIKPSNILVTLHDGLPVPKVIDFGIAKAIERRLTDKTLFTEFQAFVGTPAYTSPEQAEMSELDIDTRSDLYSLGVLLYELLTGQTPFDPAHLLRSGLDEMRRIIREEEPIPPSTRLNTLGVAQATALATTRQAKMPALVHLVRGDLDWIVMKCLEKERTRRYPTANDLALDIQRYLRNQPVLARPPSAAYTIQKFVRRNKVAVAAGAIVTLVLALAAVVSSWQALRATRAEHQESRLRRTAEEAQQAEAKQRRRAELEELAALRRAYNSDMNLVPQALAANNYGRVIDLLNRQRPNLNSQVPKPKTQSEPDFRQWEWRYFWNQSQSDAAFALPQQSNSINGLAISPDGRFMVSSSMRGTLKLWDLFRRAEVTAFRERTFGPAVFAFSPTEDRFAAAVSGGPRRTVLKVWAVATREVAAESACEGGVESLAFSPDGTKLFILGQDMAIQVWDFKKQPLAVQTQIELPRERSRRVALFSPDARYLAIGDENGRIRLIDLATGAETNSLTAFDGEIASLAFSPDGALLAATARFTHTAIKLFSTQTGAEAGQLLGHVSWVRGLTFTADGRRLVSAGADQTVRIWDIQERRELAALRGHLSEVSCVAVTPDGKTILSGCKDGTLFGWDAQRPDRKKPFETLPVRVADLQFFPDTQGMLSLNADGTVSLWDPATLQKTERITALGSDVARLIVSPDCARLYAGTRQGDIQVLDWTARLVITNLSGFSGRGFPGGPPGHGPFGGRNFAFGPVGLIDNGRTLVTAGSDSTIRLWDTASWQSKGAWKVNAAKPGEGPPFFPAQIALSRDERFLLVGGLAGFDFRSLLDGHTESSLTNQNRGVSGTAFSPDGNLLAVSSMEGAVHLWDLSEHKIVDVLRGHLLGVHAVAFSPDGQRLASGSVGNEAVKLWDVATRHEVATLAGEGSIFSLVKFSPDGNLLVAVNAEGKAHIWRAPSLQQLAKIEAGNSL